MKTRMHRPPTAMAAVAAAVLCCPAIGAGPGREGGKGRAKNVPVTGVALMSKDYEREKLRMLEDGCDRERVDEMGMRLPMHVGEQATLAAAVGPATNKKAIRASDDPTRATVENGVVAAVGRGWAQVVAVTEDGQRADVGRGIIYSIKEQSTGGRHDAVGSGQHSL